MKSSPSFASSSSSMRSVTWASFSVSPGKGNRACMDSVKSVGDSQGSISYLLTALKAPPHPRSSAPGHRRTGPRPWRSPCLPCESPLLGSGDVRSGREGSRWNMLYVKYNFDDNASKPHKHVLNAWVQINHPINLPAPSPPKRQPQKGNTNVIWIMNKQAKFTKCFSEGNNFKE